MGEIGKSKYIITLLCDNCGGETSVDLVADLYQHPCIGEVWDKCKHCDGCLYIVGVRWLV